MCVPRIKIVKVSSNTADMYNLRVAAYEVEFDRENNQTCITYTIGDTPGVA